MLTEVFVYGTLRSGQGNHYHLAGATFLRHARTEPTWQMWHLGGYPCITWTWRGVPIVGEVYQVDDKTLARLDRLEGAPSLYHRQLIHLLDGSTVLGYVMSHDRKWSNIEIPTGDWLDGVASHYNAIDYTRED